MEFFQRLGSLVSARWKTRNYNEEVFPEIASAALNELPPAQHVSLWDAVKWAMLTDQLPRQDDIEAKFGEPPLTVYTGRKFRIEVLFWTQGIPAIHQHGFSGAFHVMHGSSIHTLWDFNRVQQVEARLIIGDVRFRSGEILLKGDSRPILAGDAMFHATYHLDRPSISVVVRTLLEADKQPQYNLLPPTLAYDPYNRISTVKRQTQLLDMLVTAKRRAELIQLLRYACATHDAYSLFMFLQSAFGSIDDELEREEVLLHARVRHRQLIEALEPALRQDAIGNKILNLRRNTDDPRLQLFLALLRNIPDRSTILRLLEQRFGGGHAAATVTQCVRQLSESGALGIRLSESLLALVERLLLDQSGAEIAHALNGRSPGGQVAIEQLRQACATLQSSWLLRSLFPSNPFENTAAAADSTDNASLPLQADNKRLASAFRCMLDAQPDSLVPPQLCRNRPLNGATWTVNPLLSYSNDGQCPDDAVPFTDAVTSPEPTVWVVNPVTSMTSPFVLGALAPIVSALQPGQDIARALAPEVMQRLLAAGVIYDRPAVDEQRSAWHASLLAAGQRFRSGYVAMGALLHPFTLSAARAHYREFIQHGGAHYGDRQVPRRWAAHNEPVARFLLHQLAPVVEAIAGVPIKPSYVYFASYYDGAKLDKHVDRPQCEYSMSMLLDYSPEPSTESPWPLWLDTDDGAVAVKQCLGDTLIYRGRQLPHYRDELPAGHRSTHLFFHYVDRDFAGPLS